MRVKWFTVALGIGVGIALVAIDVSEAFAQKAKGLGRGPGVGLRAPGWSGPGMSGGSVGVFIGNAPSYSPASYNGYPYYFPYYTRPYPHSIYYQSPAYSYTTPRPAYQSYYYSAPATRPPRPPAIQTPVTQPPPAQPPTKQPPSVPQPGQQPGTHHPPGIPTTEQETAIPVVNVGIHDNYFLPNQIEINAGTTVRWTNQGQNQHNIVQPGTDWRSQDLGHGEGFQYTFTKPGTYVYRCTHHSEMTGTIIVK
jgi:plastocyanin